MGLNVHPVAPYGVVSSTTGSVANSVNGTTTGSGVGGKGSMMIQISEYPSTHTSALGAISNAGPGMQSQQHGGVSTAAQRMPSIRQGSANQRDRED